LICNSIARGSLKSEGFGDGCTVVWSELKCGVPKVRDCMITERYLGALPPSPQNLSLYNQRHNRFGCNNSRIFIVFLHTIPEILCDVATVSKVSCFFNFSSL
jgi:hypothetical protein